MTSHRTLNLLDRWICSNAGDWEMWLSWKCERIGALSPGPAMHIFNMQLFSNCCKLHFDTELIQSIGKLEHTQTNCIRLAMVLPLPSIHEYASSWRKNYELFSTMTSFLYNLLVTLLLLNFMIWIGDVCRNVDISKLSWKCSIVLA